jgi:hypothetical protein
VLFIVIALRRVLLFGRQPRFSALAIVFLRLRVANQAITFIWARRPHQTGAAQCPAVTDVLAATGQPLFHLGGDTRGKLRFP